MSLRESYETSYAYGEAQVFDEYERNRELARTARRHIRSGEFGLDLGCNDGVVAEFLRSLGAEVVGLDFSTRALGFARTRGLKYLCLGDAEKTLPFGDRVFDYVFWGDNAEHLLAPMATLREIRRVVRPGGLLVMSVPNMGWIVNRAYYLLTGMPRRTEGHLNPPWEWEHIRFFNPGVLERFLREGGFEITALHGSERRPPFGWLSKFMPRTMSSTLLVYARSVK